MSKFDFNKSIEKAVCFLKTSQISIEDGDYDFGVSRAYYALFFVARAILFTKDVKPRTHSGTISAFGEFFIKNNTFPKRFGRSFNEAFELRLLGDYEFTKQISKDQALEIYKNAEEFVEIIINYLKDKI